MYLSIQYLRGVAAFAVVYFHLYQTTGQQGVSIFFVISGFIMIYIMNRKNRTFVEFFKARFLRVAPLYYLLTLLTLLLGIAYDPTILRIVQSFSFTALGSILPVGWTLTFEFIFYTLVAVSVLMFKRFVYRLIFLFISLILGDYILNNILVSKNYEYGNYFWFFVFGIIVYLVYQKKDLLNKSKFIDIALIILFILSTIYLFLGKYLGFAFYVDSVNHYIQNNLLPSFVLVLTVLLLEARMNIFKSKILLLLGDASYSIYLTHLIVICSFEKYISKDFNHLIMLISCVFIGIFCYKFLEIPLIKYVKNRNNESKTI